MSPLHSASFLSGHLRSRKGLNNAVQEARLQWQSHTALNSPRKANASPNEVQLMGKCSEASALSISQPAITQSSNHVSNSPTLIKMDQKKMQSILLFFLGKTLEVFKYHNILKTWANPTEDKQWGLFLAERLEPLNKIQISNTPRFLIKRNSLWIR